jgi:hypothetical protein
MQKLIATTHVAGLRANNSTPLICWVEVTEADALELSLGEDHPDHTARIGAYRVTSDGRVWVNEDQTMMKERWCRLSSPLPAPNR